MHHDNPDSGADGAVIPCCPKLEKCESCDVLTFEYRLPFRPTVAVQGRRQVVPVEVTLRFRMERCPGPLSPGDLLYSTTLLPGEKVRLFTSDRRTRFSFDSQSRLAYRNQATSEESFYTSGFASAMSNLSILERDSRTAESSQTSSGGGVSGGFNFLGLIQIGGSVSGSSHNAHSASTLTRQLTQHAESASRHVESGVRHASATSVGEVQSRTHSESESEDHFESASRVFANPNRCRAITFYFYQIDKCQTIRFSLIGIDRRVDDPAAPTGVAVTPATPDGGVDVVPTSVPADKGTRLEVERAARTSVVEREAFVAAGQADRLTDVRLRASALLAAQETIAIDLQTAALQQVDKELMAEGLIDDRGEVAPQARERYGWVRTITLPTPGVIVKGCLDDCSICEPELEEEIKLDLERRHLENELLKRRIDLLDKSQEYRCCPEGSEPDA
jgi:hypothetical protein